MLQERPLAVILAGGIGTRLFPLTQERAKPAVPFGGKYRIIDFTLSNCLHSGLRQILVITQYKSFSLQKHLRDGWSILSPSMGEYITPVPPQMRVGESWYVGTADAVYQNLYLLERSGARWVVILSGDHIYRMDYEAMFDFHRKIEAEATVACIEMPLEEARHFGVVGIDDAGRIRSFSEKPERPEPMPGHSDRAFVSMGIYVFPVEFLCRTLEQDHRLQQSRHDFGKDVIPHLIERHRVYAYRFGGASGRVSVDRYWKDVGTLDAFYGANMDLLLPSPPIDLYQAEWPIRTFEAQSPPARTVPGRTGQEAELVNSMLASGTLVRGGCVRHSILSTNVRVEEGAEVEGSILFSDVVVEENARLRNCIIDKHVRVPAGQRIGFDLEAERKRFSVSDKGIVVVPRGYDFPAHGRARHRQGQA